MQDAGQTSCDEVLPDAVQVPQPPDVVQVPDVEEPDVQELDHDDDLSFMANDIQPMYDDNGPLPILHHDIISIGQADDMGLLNASFDIGSSPVRQEVVVEQGNLPSLYVSSSSSASIRIWYDLVCIHLIGNDVAIDMNDPVITTPTKKKKIVLKVTYFCIHILYSEICSRDRLLILSKFSERDVIWQCRIC